MKYILIILFITPLALNAQTHVEISFPMGLSNLVNTSVGNDYEYLQAPVHSSNQFAMGLDVNLCPWSSEHFEFFVGVGYRSLSYEAQQKLTQDSYAWTYRDIHLKSTDHLYGFHLAARYNFWVRSAHSLGVKGSLGYMLTLKNQTSIKIDQESFFTNDTEQFEYFAPSFPGIRPASKYAGSLVYLYGRNKFRLKGEAGYEYFNRRSSDEHAKSGGDWYFLYASLGIKFFF